MAILSGRDTAEVNLKSNRIKDIDGLLFVLREVAASRVPPIP